MKHEHDGAAAATSPSRGNRARPTVTAVCSCMSEPSAPARHTNRQRYCKSNSAEICSVITGEKSLTHCALLQINLKLAKQQVSEQAVLSLLVHELMKPYYSENCLIFITNVCRTFILDTL